MPTLIHELLSSPAFELIARIILTSFFWVAGVFSIVKFNTMVQSIKAYRLPMPKLIVVLMVITELIGSALLITNVGNLGWLGAGALGVFTLLSIPLGHAFWKLEPPRKMEEFQIALEHVGIIGGLMCAAALTA